MKTEIKCRIEMIGRAVVHEKERLRGEPGSCLHGLFTELETIQEELRVAAGRQALGEFGFRAYALRRVVAAAALHEWMADVALVARSLPVERYPGLAERFRLPRSQSYQAQHASALAFFKELRDHQAIFAPRGFDEEAIVEAEALLERIESANRAKISHVLLRMHKTVDLMRSSSRGLAVVREIDAILQRKLRGTPLLAEWNSVSRVHRPRKKRAKRPGKAAAPTKAKAGDGIPAANAPAPVAGAKAGGAAETPQPLHPAPFPPAAPSPAAPPPSGGPGPFSTPST